MHCPCAKDSVLVLVSGGVDSAVAVLELLEQGLNVEALFLRLFDHETTDETCSAAAELAERMGVRLHVRNLAEEFRSEIISYFVESYRQGLTPNPCVRCNPLIKVGRGLEIMKELGFSRIATGHYARIEETRSGLRLLRGCDSSKDQSYFLHGIDRCALSRIVFPLGNMQKQDVKSRAEEAGIGSAVQKESQDVCFLHEDYRDFLKRHGVLNRGPGKMYDVHGNQVGEHGGLENYTIGQRRGLGLPGPAPAYVVRIDVSENRLVVGPESALYSSEAKLRDVNWLVPPEEVVGASMDEGGYRFSCDVKIRYRHRAAPACVNVCGDTVSVHFEEPQRAITPGQFAVFYADNTVIGGGEICA